MSRNRLSMVTTFLVSVALLGCGDGGSSSVDPNEDLSGLWSFSDSLLNWGRGKTCTTGRGTLTITQTGPTFSGSLTDETTCLVIDTTNTGVRAGPISVGTVAGSQVSFEVAFCEYVATTSGGNPPTQMIGTETCILHYGTGTDSSFSNADWQASR